MTIADIGIIGFRHTQNPGPHPSQTVHGPLLGPKEILLPGIGSALCVWKTKGISMFNQLSVYHPAVRQIHIGNDPAKSVSSQIFGVHTQILVPDQTPQIPPSLFGIKLCLFGAMSSFRTINPLKTDLFS